MPTKTTVEGLANALACYRRGEGLNIDGRDWVCVQECSGQAREVPQLWAWKDDLARRGTTVELAKIAFNAGTRIGMIAKPGRKPYGAHPATVAQRADGKGKPGRKPHQDLPSSLLRQAEDALAKLRSRVTGLRERLTAAEQEAKTTEALVAVLRKTCGKPAAPAPGVLDPSSNGHHEYEPDPVGAK